MLQLAILSAGLASLLAVNAQFCGHDNNGTICPASAPCCSVAGYCGGTPAHCASNCRVLFSASLDSCQPIPVCQPGTYTFGTGGNARIGTIDQYPQPDPSDVDFLVMGGGEIQQTAEGVLLKLDNITRTTGTTLASTRAMLYGRISIEMQTGWSAGVVSAAILIGQTTEEIDIEFVGSELTQMQTNLFYNYTPYGTTWDLLTARDATTGLPLYDATVDTSTAIHKYDIDWTPDYINWAVDDNPVRTVRPSQSHIPELPIIWPGGNSSNAGTRAWAGAPDGINWTDTRYVDNGGFFDVLLKSVTIQCYDAYAADQYYSYRPTGVTAQVTP